jgi:hypothetical protein
MYLTHALEFRTERVLPARLHRRFGGHVRAGLGWLQSALLTTARKPSPGSRPGIRRMVSNTKAPGTEATTSSFSSGSSEQVE